MLRAGAAVVDITPGTNWPMGGYGLRKHNSTGTHDPIHVRTFVFDDGDTRIALAVCDMVGVWPALVARVRALVANDHGIAPDNVCLAATHTHSGPIILNSMPALVEVTAHKVAGAVGLALRQLRPVALKHATADVRSVGANRRRPGGPMDALAQVLVADPGSGASPAFTLVNYACHATVMEWDNLEYSADFPGAVCRVIEATVGGPAVYMQGACGDINPTWMRHDFAEVERVGGILGGAAIRAVNELRPVGDGQWVINVSWDEELPVDPAPGTLLGVSPLASAQAHLDLPRKVLPSQDQLESDYEAAIAAHDALPPGAIDDRRRQRAINNELRMSRSRKRTFPADEGDTQQVELQAFRLSPECAILALPGELFSELGLNLRARSPFAHTLICGYANDFVSYLPTPHEFHEHGYEIGSAIFAPEASTMLVDRAILLLHEVHDA